MIDKFNSLELLFDEMRTEFTFFLFQVDNIKILITSLGLSSYSRDESSGTG